MATVTESGWQGTQDPLFQVVVVAEEGEEEVEEQQQEEEQQEQQEEEGFIDKTCK